VANQEIEHHVGQFQVN